MDSQWWKENGLVLVVFFTCVILVAFGVDRCSQVQMKKIEANQAIKLNKAEEGHKFKFGITKEAK